MTWVRKDDQMPINRKVSALSDAAYRLDDEAICWASRNLTDGVIAADDLEGVGKRPTLKIAAELVRRGRWHSAGYECPSEHCPKPGPDGWVIHDYLEYNPTKEQVIKDRTAKAERQKRWREAKTGKHGSRDASTATSPEPSHDASQDAQVTPTPLPPRPAPKEGGGGAPQRLPAAGGGVAAAGGGARDHPTSLPEPYGPEDPQVIAAEAARLREIADERARHNADSNGRAHRGAAAARAALSTALSTSEERT